ncbi:hypothetical protein [Aurantiacibacter gangjinensis]|uniref:Uncharacterized protein n=1 Tax=Aurantiacibacter gangjinensis TaxID=502682 RepID=A0A0G9MMX9_9SPHN|nr:hypothetical protein [Aurantiacibacter gangjinensis]APE28055.1 hypothetical protein BMF35_a1226 [Aurantiacibacter gangjinensis]KLE31979.1 hypothetical protein AAW01_11130 [Aurantiacibacter gangjinensis]
MTRWPRYAEMRKAFAEDLDAYSREVRELPGVGDDASRDTLALQLVASVRRERYFELLQERGAIPAFRANPHDDRFEAELGLVHLLQRGQIDEAAWLVFLMTVFGKPAGSGWKRLRDVYGRLGTARADWNSMQAQPDLLETWLARHWQEVGGDQGGHRRYESMRPDSRRPIGRAITQYANWIGCAGGHEAKFAQLVREAGNSREAIFDEFFRALPCVGFARLGRFDWVSMLDRYGIVHATPGSAYLRGSTGPLRGASLLFTGSTKAPARLTASFEKWLLELDGRVEVGMKVWEDALCNWQKHPAHFVHYKG